jgi:dienelactone hydrolase
MRISILCFLACIALGTATAQEAVYFYTRDSVKVRGDLYLSSYNRPFIILCHQDASNRTEFYTIAPRLLNLNYNCLAIDLRSGGSVGFTENETNRNALMAGHHTQPLDAGNDVKAAIEYVKHFNNQPVVLLGSSVSASLCLLTARGNPAVNAVVALSPGEFFEPRISMAAEMARIDKPVFVAATQQDYPYLKQMTSRCPAGRVTLFKPEKGRGVRGTAALSAPGATRDETWFALMMFFKEVTRDEGQGTRDKGQGTRDEGQGTRDEGQGTRDEEE